jgi:RND family efflux transporter MFP subunit
MTRHLAIFALGLAAIGPPACSRGEHAPAAKSGPPIAVTVARAIAVDTAERLEAGGVVAADESASISTRLAATIIRVHARAGDRVRAGDTLITLDARDMAEHTRQAHADAEAAEQARAQARSARVAAEADHRLAAAWQTRVAALHARSSATDQERDEAEARLSAATARLAGAAASIESAAAQVASARAAVGAAAATESFATVRAPFDGLVTERLTDPGNLAVPGVPLLRIDADGARHVVVRVDEARVRYVRPGDRVRLELTAPDEQAGTDAVIEGVVGEVARAVGADERAFTVKVSVPPAVRARTGSFARVVFRGATRRALFVPADAVQRLGQVSSVFVVENGVARLRLIQAGARAPEGIEVLAGLDSGESIVTSPLTRLADGARVAPAAGPTAPGGAS